MDKYTRREFMKKTGLGFACLGLLSQKSVEAKAATENTSNDKLSEILSKGPIYSGACNTDYRDFPDLCRK